MTEIDVATDLSQITIQLEQLVGQVNQLNIQRDQLNTQRDQLTQQIHNLNGIVMYLRGKQNNNTNNGTVIADMDTIDVEEIPNN